MFHGLLLPVKILGNQFQPASCDHCKSWLTFWLMSVGSNSSSWMVLLGSGGSTGPFWDRFVEVVPPSSRFAFLVVIGVCDVFSGLAGVSSSLFSSSDAGVVASGVRGQHPGIGGHL